MRRMLTAMTLMPLAAACPRVLPIKADAHCDGSRIARADHAVALVASVDDGGGATGTRLTALIEAAGTG